MKQIPTILQGFCNFLLDNVVLRFNGKSPKQLNKVELMDWQLISGEINWSGSFLLRSEGWGEGRGETRELLNFEEKVDLRI